MFGKKDDGHGDDEDHARAGNADVGEIVETSDEEEEMNATEVDREKDRQDLFFHVHTG